MNLAGLVLLPFAVALIAGALVAQPIFQLLLKLKSRQTVSQYVPEHAAKQGTPTMGGLIIGVGFLFGLLPMFQYFASNLQRYYIAAMVLYVLYAIIGFVDDFVVPRMMAGKRGLGWTQKLLMQIVSVLVFVAIMGRSIPPVELGVGIFLILFFSNAYNFSDGLDALAGSLLVTFSLGLAALSFIAHQPTTAPLLASFIGAALPFLWYNRPPARVFMGDVGALPIGAVLGLVVAALALPHWQTLYFDHPTDSTLPPGMMLWIGLAVASFVMIAELVPVPLQILSVKVRKKRIFPATPIHHSFQRAGWKETRVVAMFVGVQIVCAILGVLIAQLGVPH